MNTEDKIAEQAAEIDRLHLAGADEVQWRNIRKVVRYMATFCFGGATEPGQISLGAAYTAIITSLDAKDEVRVQLEPLPNVPMGAEIARLTKTIAWYQRQAGQRIGEAARAGIAGAPASVPVNAPLSAEIEAEAKAFEATLPHVVMRWGSILYPWGWRYANDAVQEQFKDWCNRRAAPAPVSGMPDDVAVLRNWAVQIERMSSVFDDERSLLCQQAAILLRRIAYLPSPQAPDTPNPTGETK